MAGLNHFRYAAALVILAGLTSGYAGAQVLPEYGTILKSHPEHGRMKFPEVMAPPSAPRPAAQPFGDIAFVRDGDIYTVTVDGGSFRQLTADGRNAFPIWSPSGRYIAFSKAEPVGGGMTAAGLWIVTSDGKYTRRLVKAQGVCYLLAWLPKDAGVIYDRIDLETEYVPDIEVCHLRSAPNPEAPMDRWQASAERRFGKRWLAFGQALAFSPSFKELVVVGSVYVDDDDAVTSLFRMSYDGSRMTKLAPLEQEVMCLRWHPSAPKFLSAELDCSRPHGSGSIWLRTTDGRLAKKLADTAGVSYSGMDWSPMGSYIVFQVTDKEYPDFEHPEQFGTLSHHSSVWAMKTDGTEKYKLADNACHPNWR